MFTFINTFNFNINKFYTNNLKYNIYLNRSLFQLLSLFIHGQDITLMSISIIVYNSQKNTTINILLSNNNNDKYEKYNK